MKKSLKNILHRGYIHDEVYPRKTRMNKSAIVNNFWDFYALELLRCRAKALEVDFYQQERIENLLRYTTTKLLQEQVRALEASIRGEIRYFIKACNEKDGINVACHIKSEFLRECYCDSSPLSMDLETIKEIFQKTGIWVREYGGRSWARATETLIHAKKALKENNLDQMVVFVDMIFDIHHNDGFVLNKTNFAVLENSDLDMRSEIRTLNVFVEEAYYKGLLSPYIKAEIKTFLKKHE